MNTTTTELVDMLEAALDIATNHGDRRWLPGRKPEIVAGVEMAALVSAPLEFRLTALPAGAVQMDVLLDGELREQATFSAGLAHLAITYIGEGLR